MTYKLSWLLPLLLNLITLDTYAQTGNPPPCNEVKQVNLITDDTKRRILFDFVQQCERDEWKNDKGIIHLREYHNAQSKLCWLLLPSIDNEYKESPLSRFMDFQEDIILIFDADSN